MSLFGDSPIGFLGNDKLQFVLGLLGQGNQWIQNQRAGLQNARLMDAIMKGYEQRKEWEGGRFDSLTNALNQAGQQQQAGLGKAQQTLNTAYPSADPRNAASDAAMLLWGQRYPYGFNRTMQSMGQPQR